MDKITLYKQGGKLFYKDKSGKMLEYRGGGPTRFRLPKYQDAGYISNGMSPTLREASGNTGNVTTWGTGNPYKGEIVDRNVKKPAKGMSNKDITDLANTASSVMSIIPRQGFDPTNEYSRSAFSKTQDINDTSRKTLDGVSSAIPMWGALANATRGLTDLMNPKDENGISKSGVGMAAANMISPSNNLMTAIGTGAKYGTAAGILDQLSFGHAGRDLRQRTQKVAESVLDEDREREGMFNDSEARNQRNDGIYAQRGGSVYRPQRESNVNRGRWNAEIENGEIVLGNPAAMKYGGNSSPSMVSPYAVKFTGDKHGQDTDRDGQQGIPLRAPEGSYVASNYLGVDGKKAKPGQKTVAKTMEPIVRSLSNAEKHGDDIYKNNPKFITNQIKQLNKIKEQAEINKAIVNARNQPGRYQTGGGLTSDEVLRKKMENYAVNKMDIPRHLAESAVEDDPANYSFKNPDKYMGYNVDSYKKENIITRGAPEVTVEDPSIVEDHRKGIIADITTLAEQAGRSPYTGTSNLAQEKISEMLGRDVFDEYGHVTPKWKDKLLREYKIPSEEVDAARMETITKGNVGKAFGLMLEDAYGVLGKGRDELNNKVDVGVSGKTTQPRIDNKLNWAQDIVTIIQENDGVLPSEYSSLAEDLKDELTNIARTHGSASKGKFSPSLSRAYAEASVADTSEIARQKSLSYKTDETDAARIDSKHDLLFDGVDGRSLEFGEAFNWAAAKKMPTFTWKGKLYNTDVAPEKTKSDGGRAIKNSATSAPKNNTTVKPLELNRGVITPTRKLTELQYGGYSGQEMNQNAYNNFNQQEMNRRRTGYNSYQMGGGMEGEAPNESNQHMMQLAQEQAAAEQMQAAGQMQPGMEEGMEEGMDAGMGQLPIQLQEIDPQLQQLFMQLNPEQQEQLLQLPVEQLEIALMNIAQQMMTEQQGEQQAAPQGPVTNEVPPEVMARFGAML